MARNLLRVPRASSVASAPAVAAPSDGRAAQAHVGSPHPSCQRVPSPTPPGSQAIHRPPAAWPQRDGVEWRRTESVRPGDASAGNRASLARERRVRRLAAHGQGTVEGNDEWRRRGPMRSRRRCWWSKTKSRSASWWRPRSGFAASPSQTAAAGRDALALGRNVAVRPDRARRQPARSRRLRHLPQIARRRQCRAGHLFDGARRSVRFARRLYRRRRRLRDQAVQPGRAGVAGRSGACAAPGPRRPCPSGSSPATSCSTKRPIAFGATGDRALPVADRISPPPLFAAQPRPGRLQNRRFSITSGTTNSRSIRRRSKPTSAICGANWTTGTGN